MKRDVWLEGRTKRRGLKRGRHVEIIGDPYVDSDAEVYVDGKLVQIKHVSRLRDGGTTMIKTDAGEIVRQAPRFEAKPTLDGEELL